jgi:hypothetical protein
MRKNLLTLTGATVVTMAVAGALALGIFTPVSAQQGGRGGGAPQAPATPQSMAPFDITGTWVSVITEDWRFRMVTPPRGDFASLNLNAEGQKVGNAWDPQADIAANQQCRAYGAIGLMRMPTRLRISWQDANTIRVEADAGTQTRIFHVGAPGTASLQTNLAANRGAPSWQGYSVASWVTQAEGSGAAQGGGGGRGGGGGAPQLNGGLRVVTTNLLPGYHRRNGAPYSANAVYTEYFDRVAGPQNEHWLIVTSIVDDPMYLNGPFMNSTQFKLEPDASKFRPTPCEVGLLTENAVPARGRGAAPAAPAAPAGGGAGRGGRGN